MRINYTMVGTALTGGTRVVLEIANGLVECGHHVTITTLGQPQDTNWINLKAEVKYVRDYLFKARPLEWVRWKAGVDLWPDLQIRRLAEAIPECDVNIATFNFTAFSVHRSGKGRGFYHMQHDETLFYEEGYTKNLASESYYLPLKKIANSIWLRNRFVSKQLNEPTMPIVNPAIDHDVFKNGYNYNRSTKKFTIVSLGKETVWKGLPDLFEALAIVRKSLPNIELQLFGCSSLSPNINTYGVPYSCVGRKVNKDLAQLYADAHLVVSPSWYESFPLPQLEAMAVGTPVVTTRYGTEDYTKHEINSLVVDPQQPQQMASAIIRMLTDESLRNKCTANGFLTSKEFTWEKTAESMDNILRSL